MHPAQQRLIPPLFPQTPLADRRSRPRHIQEIPRCQHQHAQGDKCYEGHPDEFVFRAHQVPDSQRDGVHGSGGGFDNGGPVGVLERYRLEEGV